MPFRPESRPLPSPADRLVLAAMRGAGLAGSLCWQGGWSIAARSAPRVAIVGTREPTALAEELAHLLAYQLASAGVTVVSGGARGIDHAAHRGALEGGGATIIVLPAGLAALESHRWDHWLADDHVADRMLFLSPFPPETPISRQTPVIRNRLTAALAEAVVVVEAGQTSGTWHCVRHAESLAVPVFVPGNPGAGSRGSGRRIFEARSVSSSDLARDVLAAARWFREREELARAAQLSFLPEEL